MSLSPELAAPSASPDLAHDDGGTRPVVGPVVALINLGVLLQLDSLDAPPGLSAPFLLATFAGLSALVARHYVRGGRLAATPALVLYALMTLYTVPVVVSDLLFDYGLYQSLARPAMVLAVAMNGAAVVLLAFDRPGPSPQAAGLVERHQWPIAFASYVLLAAGVLWLFVNFQDLGSLYHYLFEVSYYEKHIYFQGKAFLGLFNVCFELAGMLAVVALAVPRGARRCPWPVSAASLAVVTLASVNQGYRTTIVLIMGQYLVARAFWAGSGVRVAVLGVVAAVLAPIFLMWAYVRAYLSSGLILDLRGISDQLAAADWTNLNESEIGVTLLNGGHLLKLLETGAWRHRWGETLLMDPLIAIVPRAVWADRPEALQIAFTRTVDPSYAEGGTLSFSFVLEGYLNFGILGAAAWSGLLAWLLVVSRRRTEAAGARDGWVLGLALLVLNAQVWFYIRDDFGDLARRAAIALTILGAAAWLARAAQLLAPPPADDAGRRRPTNGPPPGNDPLTPAEPQP